VAVAVVDVERTGPGEATDGERRSEGVDLGDDGGHERGAAAPGERLPDGGADVSVELGPGEGESFQRVQRVGHAAPYYNGKILASLKGYREGMGEI
jgi:hypothetical protein